MLQHGHHQQSVPTMALVSKHIVMMRRRRQSMVLRGTTQVGNHPFYSLDILRSQWRSFCTRSCTGFEHSSNAGVQGGSQAAPVASSQENASDSEDKEEMDLQKALNIVTEHYSRRNAQLLIMHSFSRDFVTERLQTAAAACMHPLHFAAHAQMTIVWWITSFLPGALCVHVLGVVQGQERGEKGCTVQKETVRTYLQTMYSLLWAALLRTVLPVSPCEADVSSWALVIALSPCYCKCRHKRDSEDEDLRQSHSKKKKKKKRRSKGD